jgi:hypothetical protein
MLLPMLQAARYTEAMTKEAKQRVLHARRAVCSAGPGLILTLLLPKCPLCVAALLGSLGLGSALAAELAPHLRYLALLALVLPLAYFAITRIRTQRSACGCVKSRQTPPPQTSHSHNRPAQPQTSIS